MTGTFCPSLDSMLAEQNAGDCGNGGIEDGVEGKEEKGTSEKETSENEGGMEIDSEGITTADEAFWRSGLEEIDEFFGRDYR